MTITTRLHTFFHGKLVGTDQFGNRYFTEKKTSAKRHTKRWVLYKGKAEPSKVPAEWHGWLHYTLDAPLEISATPYAWKKEHIPNLTGTANAYVPPGHLLRGGHRDPSTSDYEAWKP
jgi:NADH:ubiquinone oxidoreductase subunit